MPDTPADTLRAAATLLRERAADALHISPLPWTIKTGGAYGTGSVVAANRDIIVDRSDARHEDAIDLPYIALMHPGVGELIAAWLESAAVSAEMIGADHLAMAVARAVLEAGQ